MEFLAIKSEPGKGVYAFADKKTKNDILKKYPGCSHRIFTGKQEDAATKWAGVGGIANVPQVAAPICTETKKDKKAGQHPFFQTLSACFYMIRSLSLILHMNYST